MSLTLDVHRRATREIDVRSPSEPFRLESGAALPRITVAFETYGTLNRDGTNALLICHALTADARAGDSDSGPGWWGGLIGEGKAFDTEKYYVVAPNILGSCYGTTGPVSIDPKSGRRYGPRFPDITIRDIVRVQKLLLDSLGVRRLAAVSGSSLGGMQVLEWPLLYPGFCERIIPISTALRQPAWCIGLNAAARRAITNDPGWMDGEYASQPVEGLSLARMIGMISYRSFAEFEDRFGRDRQEGTDLFAIESYLHYQGRKLADRFDANTYLKLSRAMDSHDISRDRGSLEDALRAVRTHTLAIGISTDSRYPRHLQQEIAHRITDAEYREIDSIHGHDAFLIEFGALNEVIGEFLER